VFEVFLRRCEWWLCPYEASCNVFSELGPVGGPINANDDVLFPSHTSPEPYNFGHQATLSGMGMKLPAIIGRARTSNSR
jgi:hypothetical protein